MHQAPHYLEDVRSTRVYMRLITCVIKFKLINTFFIWSIVKEDFYSLDLPHK